MKKLDSISIGIASYNRPILLRETLRSIEDLSLMLEVIIVDDDSPRYEEIKSVVNDFNQSHIRIKLYKNESNMGEVKTKIRMFSLIKTKYLFMLGDDDTLDKRASIFFSVFSKDNSDYDFVFCGYRIIDQNDHVQKVRRSLITFSSQTSSTSYLKLFSRFVTFPFYYFHPALYLVKTSSAIRLSLDYSIGIGEDYDLLWRVFNNPSVNWKIIPEVLVNWRKHEIQSANQSANLQKRLETKISIYKKFKDSKLPLVKFWFVFIPAFFDKKRDIDIRVVEASRSQIFLLSVLSSKLPRLFLLVFYNTYKVLEYSFIHLLFFKKWSR